MRPITFLRSIKIIGTISWLNIYNNALNIDCMKRAGMVMNNSSIRLTVLFEDPFWIGFFERTDGEGYSVARTVFGAEPTNIELYHFFLKRYNQLKFGTLVGTKVCEQKPEKKINPKRKQREAQKELNNKSTVTKAHEAIKLLQGQVKVERKESNKLRREEEETWKFQLKQVKRKKKHRGH